jgi:hypothetical protein
MAAKPQDVEAFLAASTHARLAEVRDVRAALLAAMPELTERVKWNAPSLGPDGTDRITFRLQPGDRVELVLHRGTASRPDDGFAFDDPDGVIAWAAPDRGVIVVRDADDLAERRTLIVATCRRWVEATRD